MRRTASSSSTRSSFDLQRLRQLGDVVEERGAAVGVLDAGPACSCASLPNSSASSSGSLIAAQLMRTNGAARRGDISWMRSANRSLPTPVSPRIRTLSLPTAMRDGRLLERGELARLRRRSRGASRRASAPSRVTPPIRNGMPMPSADALVRGEACAVDERAVRAADVLDLDVLADQRGSRGGARPSRSRSRRRTSASGRS